MRHQKRTVKLNRTGSHRKALFSNMLKSLVIHGQITTTLPKAKELRRYADQLITLAKKDTLSSRRSAISKMSVCYNSLSSKEARLVKQGDTSPLNDDRKVITQLFDVLGKKYHDRFGGYTRIVRSGKRRGDNASLCIIEYI